MTFPPLEIPSEEMGPCCRKLWQRDLDAKKIPRGDATWICPKCGSEWEGKEHQRYREWHYRSLVETFRAPRRL